MKDRQEPFEKIGQKNKGFTLIVSKFTLFHKLNYTSLIIVVSLDKGPYNGQTETVSSKTVVIVTYL